MDSNNARPEKSFLVKASIKLGPPPTYYGEQNLEKFEGWVASPLWYMKMYNLPDHEDEEDEVIEEEVHLEEAQTDWEDPAEAEPKYEFNKDYEPSSAIEEVAV
ncbi:hypothetical protein M422DRAFT_275943 [Sphaerobolus stellatus SS14]|uniref:Uncharacterized protein n=1 Tax=Sphaerobolus stellatus (strain SS14) TaxID=990650 RepID=A0A0C9U332_SPHS4|nr:hypothetical protein M422DRAFT_275943 [Sphaerobolus stellatus SS14]